MKKIMMTKYGFERWPEEDFSDDGNRFTCYKVGDRVRVSKLVADGYAYIDARIDGRILPYEVYSNLPHFKIMGKLNGVPVNTLTDALLFELAEACLYYEKEYNAAEAAIVFPTEDEIKARCMEVRKRFETQLAELEYLMSKKNMAKLAFKIPEWEWRELRSDLIRLVKQAESYEPEAYCQYIYKTRQSFDFCKPDARILEDTFYYDRIKKTLSMY
jgi:hypothetical protein